MVDFNKARKDKPFSSHTAPAESTQPSKIAYPSGCDESMAIGNEPIAEIGIGEALTGHILAIKAVQTATMKNPNNLITFYDKAYGTFKFWSSGALNQLLNNTPDIESLCITIQRIEDGHFKKGDGKNWRIFVHRDKS